MNDNIRTALDSLLSTRDVATRARLAESSIRTYRTRGHLPTPDVLLGNTPGWLPETIDPWIAALPGQGTRTDLHPTPAPAVAPEEAGRPDAPPLEAATVALVWDTYDHDHTLITHLVPVTAATDPTRLTDIPTMRNPRIELTAPRLGDVPAPRYGWDEIERDDVPMFPAPRAALAVRCPKCSKPGGMPCESTGGGNRAYVPTHKARLDRIKDWTNAVQAHAEILVKAVGHHGYFHTGLFTVFEQAATPIGEKPTKKLTPKGVQLSERQAEYIEAAVEHPGPPVLYCPTTHLDGDHEHRQTILALESKGIVTETGRTSEGERTMRLTPFGWQVYRHHRLIIHHITDAEADKREAAAANPPN